MSSPGGPQTAYPNSSIERVMEWGKRKLEEDDRDVKRPCLNVYFRLESESSLDSEEDDTESVYSIQSKETDVARDTSDTDTKSEVSSDELEVEYEYEVASLTGDDDFPDNYSSSGTEDLHAETAIAAVLCDSSLDAWATDAEASDSSGDDSPLRPWDGRKDFWTCVQCKAHNDNPLFRYCDKCFQKCWMCKAAKKYTYFTLCNSCFKVRKTFFPPRPRGNRKRKLDKKPAAPGHHHQPPVQLDTLQSCLKSLTQDSGLAGLSQDSGLGSSQDLPQLDFNKIIVPEHLKTPLKKPQSSTTSSDTEDDSDQPPRKCRKLTTSYEDKSDNASQSSSKDDSNSVAKSDSDGLKSESERSTKSLRSDSGVSMSSKSSGDSELCIMCNSSPKNGIFLHGSIGHMCCCYKCAMRTWKSSKRCPVCNCKVKNVVKLFTM